tara:strand:+ start:202 stop:705 length:504 start_codon:yes stop_codon:yes gene_type:complete
MNEFEELLSNVFGKEVEKLLSNYKTKYKAMIPRSKQGSSVKSDVSSRERKGKSRSTSHQDLMRLFCDKSETVMFASMENFEFTDDEFDNLFSTAMKECQFENLDASWHSKKTLVALARNPKTPRGHLENLIKSVEEQPKTDDPSDHKHFTSYSNKMKRRAKQNLEKF